MSGYDYSVRDHQRVQAAMASIDRADIAAIVGDGWQGFYGQDDDVTGVAEDTGSDLVVFAQYGILPDTDPTVLLEGTTIRKPSIEIIWSFQRQNYTQASQCDQLVREAFAAASSPPDYRFDATNGFGQVGSGSEQWASYRTTITLIAGD